MMECNNQVSWYLYNIEQKWQISSERVNFLANLQFGESISLSFDGEYRRECHVSKEIFFHYTISNSNHVFHVSKGFQMIISSMDN